eukprot:NODE_955_length_713_cov_363.725904_g743_i0.p1 GENE.NODE_955_length_713_cov_363.725904_g743_i0~~NODE_955_length_713_cov_363.725904_g743_i0.p1  ORF type:complete len:156 (-),score=29.52 NODE_955_length_713_cov_363.725904_g743_i0:245-688(-)
MGTKAECWVCQCCQTVNPFQEGTQQCTNCLRTVLSFAPMDQAPQPPVQPVQHVKIIYVTCAEAVPPEPTPCMYLPQQQLVPQEVPQPMGEVPLQPTAPQITRPYPLQQPQVYDPYPMMGVSPCWQDVEDEEVDPDVAEANACGEYEC